MATEATCVTCGKLWPGRPLDWLHWCLADVRRCPGSISSARAAPAEEVRVHRGGWNPSDRQNQCPRDQREKGGKAEPFLGGVFATTDLDRHVRLGRREHGHERIDAEPLELASHESTSAAAWRAAAWRRRSSTSAGRCGGPNAHLDPDLHALRPTSDEKRDLHPLLVVLTVDAGARMAVVRFRCLRAPRAGRRRPSPRRPSPAVHARSS
jgi:hypothetical protein